MGYRLTPEERRIIEQTRRQGEGFYQPNTPAGNRRRVWKSVLVWIAMIVLFAGFGLLICYIGTLFG